VGPLLARAGLVLLVGLLCLYVLGRIPSVYAELVIVAGAIVWGLAMAGIFVRPNRVAFSLAIFGAVLVGTGILTFAFGSHCWCETSTSPLARLRRLLHGEPESQDFSLICT
jgi:hypothetical protein